MCLFLRAPKQCKGDNAKTPRYYNTITQGGYLRALTKGGGKTPRFQNEKVQFFLGQTIYKAYPFAASGLDVFILTGKKHITYIWKW